MARKKQPKKEDVKLMVKGSFTEVLGVLAKAKKKPDTNHTAPKQPK
jgi:hypothetical protein